MLCQQPRDTILFQFAQRHKDDGMMTDNELRALLYGFLHYRSGNVQRQQSRFHCLATIANQQAGVVKIQRFRKRRKGIDVLIDFLDRSHYDSSVSVPAIFSS